MLNQNDVFNEEGESMAKQIEGVYERILECAKKEFLEKGYTDAFSQGVVSWQDSIKTENSVNLSMPYWQKQTARGILSNKLAATNKM